MPLDAMKLQIGYQLHPAVDFFCLTYKLPLQLWPHVAPAGSSPGACS